MRTCMLAFAAVLTASAAARAQERPLRFHWKAGATLTYGVEQTTRVAEVVAGDKVETSSSHKLTKRWQVLAVDARGIATLQLSLTAFRMEQTRPNGEILRYDSADVDRSTASLKEQFETLLGRPLAVLRIDEAGKVVELVKGQADAYAAESPFLVQLPGDPMRVGTRWERPFEVVLAPPLGAGEKYAATQTFVCKQIDGARAVLALATALKVPPASALDQVPLLHKQPQGEIVFDAQAGRLESARLVIDRQVENHQGPGSSYHFTSRYVEQYGVP